MAGAIHLAKRSAQQDQHVIGMEVAAEGFLEAHIRYTTQDVLYCCAQELAQFDEFKDIAARCGVDSTRCVYLPLNDPNGISEAGCLMLRDPNIASFTWHRQRSNPQAFSLCGISHSLSTASVIEAIGACILDPTQPWDAIVCMSKTAITTIEAIWQGWRRYIDDRLAGGSGAGAQKTSEQSQIDSPCPVNLPIIPLGINTSDFVSRTSPALRQQQRQQLQIPDDAVLILAHGRHSYYSKAHPLPLFQAVESVAKREAKQIHLALYGYHPTERVGEEFRNLAHDICTTANVHFIDNSDQNFADGLWAAADIFVSLADNIQETFGLAPVEAMACGLPVIASDWDGYRETIRHQTDGFLIRTTAPGAGMGEDLAYRYFADIDTYGHFIGAAAQTTAIDAQDLTNALTNLATNADLRRKMGEAGKDHAQTNYDWRAIIPQYDELWTELDHRRKVDTNGDRGSVQDVFHPLWPDPFTVFASHPTHRLARGDRLESLINTYDDVTVLLRHRMNMFIPDILVPPEKLPILIHAIMSQPGISIGELCEAHPDWGDAPVQRSIGWLMKLGVIRLTNNGASD